MLSDSISKVWKGMRNPEMIIGELRNVAKQATYLPFNKRFEKIYGEGINVMDEDWDNLIILDACRYDHFKEVNTMQGDLYPVVSEGSHSWEFISKNFLGDSNHDTIYVTSNPFSTRIPDDSFFKVVPLLDRWEENLGTVLPESVVDAAKEAHELHPKKKLVIHFMQPHHPHLGETADRLRDEFDLAGWGKHLATRGKAKTEGLTWGEAVKEGYISEDEAHQSYRESLKIVLDNCGQLLRELDGKSVITSDHGEMIGDRVSPLHQKSFGHPKGVKCRELRIVPWLEIESERRRDVRTDSPRGFERPSEEFLNEKLEALGYASE